jgi:hypothetical protein
MAFWARRRARFVSRHFLSSALIAARSMASKMAIASASSAWRAQRERALAVLVLAHARGEAPRLLLELRPRRDSRRAPERGLGLGVAAGVAAVHARLYSAIALFSWSASATRRVCDVQRVQVALGLRARPDLPRPGSARLRAALRPAASPLLRQQAARRMAATSTPLSAAWRARPGPRPRSADRGSASLRRRGR